MDNLNGFMKNQYLKHFPDPFAYILYNFQTERYCSYCLRCPLSPKDKLLLCSNCRLSKYCNRECQRQAWIRDHKPECARLKASFPNLPLTDVLFLSRVIEKLNFIKKNGDVHNWQKDRKFEDMMTHEKETKADPEKMARFEKLYEKTKKFMGQETPEKEDFFLIFCRVWINSHSIHASVGTEIGMALDLGVSRYDHNCRPNATLVFDGFRAVLRPLVPNLDAADSSRTFISYVDVGRSKWQRRQQLWSQWYFWCQCDRCQDLEDDRLTAMKCSNPSCNHPIIITEESDPVDIVCRSCNAVTSKDTVVQAQQLMKSVPAKLSVADATDDDLGKYRSLLGQAKKLLHPGNVYLTRLVTAYTEMTGGRDTKECSVQDLVAAYESYKKYYPVTDRHIGYHLLHLIKVLIDTGRRKDAVPYAYEAMNIFEVCFGIEHPYYLKTLALWTYLDKEAQKSDRELLELMNFNYNRPVDLVTLIDKS